MTTTPLIIPTTSSPGRFGPESSGRLINAYVEKAATADRGAVVYGVDGLSLFAQHSIAGPIRGMIEVDGAGYALIGTDMMRVDPGGTMTTIGGVPGSGWVTFARNRKSPAAQIGVTTPDGLSYLIQGGTMAPLEDVDLRPANSVTGIAGYLVWTHADGTYSWSDVDDAVIDGLSYSAADANPDGLVRGLEHKGELYLFGPRTVEVHGLTGDSDLPFARVGGVGITRGCLAPASVVSSENAIAWVADDKTVRAAASYTAEKISSHAVDRAIASAAHPELIVGSTRSRHGHTFYEISAAEWTWVYDFATGYWHERKSHLSDRWRAQGYMELAGKHITGDRSTGALYELSPTVMDENGSHLVWELELVAKKSFPRGMVFNRVDLDLITGVGLNSVDAHEADPQVMLSYSDDGGRTWSSERTGAIGGIGSYGTTVSFHRLGACNAHGRRFKLKVSAAVSRCLMGATAEVTPRAA